MSTIVSRIIITNKGGDSSSPLAQVNVALLSSVTLFLLLLGISATAHLASAAATGDPIDFATIGDTTDSPKGQLLTTVNTGINFSFAVNNNLRNGVRGRPLRLIPRNNNNNASLTFGLLNDVIATYPNLTGVVAINQEESVDEAMRFVTERNMTLIQPTVGTRRYFKFSQDFLNFIPSPDAEIYNMVRHAIYSHQATRIAVVTETLDTIGSEMVPDLITLVESVGAKMTYHMKLNRQTNPTSYDIASLQQLLATKPHAVIHLGGLYANTAATLLALVVSLPTALIYHPSGSIAVVDAALRQLPSRSLIKERILMTSYGPLYTDTTYAIARRFRSEVTSNGNPLMNLTYLDATPPVGMYLYFGWVLGEVMQRVTIRLHTITPNDLKESIYADSIFSVDDVMFGPYSGPCIGLRAQFCSCNNGARINSLIRFTEEVTLLAVPGSNFTLPFDVCDAEKLPLTSPLIAATLTPSSNPDAARVTSDYLYGRNAAAMTGDILIDGALVVQTFTGNSTAALQLLNTEKLMTASAGTVLNTPISDPVTAAGLGATIDPFELRPRLYGSYRRDVIYVSPTYDQELHALANLAVSTRVGITVLSALDDGEQIGAMLTRSMHTLGQEGGGHRSVATIADGLVSQSADGITILHGISTTADITAIAVYLARTSSGILAIPMAHLDAWYREILAAVSDDAQRSRIVFATSLPNWGGPDGDGSNGATMQSYFSRVPATNRTPGTLRGFMTHQLLTQITGRIPTQKTPNEFLQMLYGASVVVLDTGLVVGPYFDTTCSTSQEGGGGSSCEMNIGARLIRVRSIAASMTDSISGNASGVDASSITLDSGRISYHGLPTSDTTTSTIIVVVAVVGCVLLLAGVVAVVIVCCCTGRSNRTAPKDESDAFTIAFTDIQSSTNLWAEAPEAMAPALDHHHAIIRKLCSKYNGYEVKTIGDAFMIAFRDAHDAVELASALQFAFFEDNSWSPQIDHAYLEMDHRNTKNMKPEERATYSIALSQEDYGKVWNGLRVRIGVHTGFGEIKKDPVSHGYDYYGTVVNTAARTEAIAHGGQVTLTESCVIASGVDHSRLIECGPVLLRGVNEPVVMFQLNCVPNRVFPLLRIENAQKEDVDVEGGGSTATSVQSLQRSLKSATNASPALQQKRSAAKNTILAMSAVMTEKKKSEWLKELSKEWRVPVPRDFATDTAAKNALLDSLAAKLAPILARKVQPINGDDGVITSTDRGTASEGTAPEAGSMFAPSQQLANSQRLSRTTSGNALTSPAFVSETEHGATLVE